MELNKDALAAYLTQSHHAPAEVDDVRELGTTKTGAAAFKAFGYGRPVQVDYHIAAPSHLEEHHRIVMRQVNRNGYGRERDSDRIAEVWLDWTSFNNLPRHVQALDVVALSESGQLTSARDARDFLLVTEFASGQPYADDLLRIGQNGNLTKRDVERAVALADYLADIHATKHDDPLLWKRRLRDLVGHGEGIMGLCDSYQPEDTCAFPLILRGIETSANEWRWRLRPMSHRLSQVHGDFHPFNVLFDDGQFRLLDRSRGPWGEPADDVSCMTINYLFFSLQRYGAMMGPFKELYEAFWERYMHRTQDVEMLSVIAPWFAWRALVLASPEWYPNISDSVRRRLLSFAQDVLSSRRFQWRELDYYLEG